MKSSGCALALLLGLLAAGCKKGPDLVGKWTASAGGKSIDIEFTADNAYTFGTSRMKSKGEYKREGDTLTLTPKDLEITGAKPDFIAKAKASPSFGTPTTATIRFEGDDVLDLSGLPGAKSAKGDPPTITLKRVKG